MVEGSSIRQNQKFWRSTSEGERFLSVQPAPYPERAMMLSRRSASMATQPMPLSAIAILSAGYFTGHGLHTHSEQVSMAIGPNSVAPSSSIGAPAGIFAKPEEPTCSESTVSVSAQARMIGSQ